MTVVAPAANGWYSPAIIFPLSSSLLNKPFLIFTCNSAVEISNAFWLDVDFDVAVISPAPLLAPGWSLSIAKPKLSVKAFPDTGNKLPRSVEISAITPTNPSPELVSVTLTRISIRSSEEN